MVEAPADLEALLKLQAVANGVCREPSRLENIELRTKKTHHDVGIFAVSDESLPVDGTVPAGSGGTLLDGFWYTSVSPTVLPAGDYVIMLTMPRLNNDTQTVSNTSETTSAPVTFETSAFASGSSLAYPTTSGALNDGIFGPNFAFTSVPEPSTWAMMLLGFASLGFAGYRTAGKGATLAD
jgi:PEP-CTERM motif